MSFSSFSLNGRLLPIDQAKVSLLSVEYAYGFGVYENIRVAHRQPYFVDDHVHRLLRSASLIGLDHAYVDQQIVLFVKELIEHTDADAFNLKILLIGGKTAEEATLAILPLAPYYPEKSWYRDGVRTKTVSAERFLPQAKTLNMLPSFLAYRDAKAADCYDALLVDRSGAVLEGTRTNLFFVNGRTIVTAPHHSILEGVTREHVLSLAAKAGMAIELRPVPLADIGRFDGAFLTSTSSKILPIRQIDEHHYATIPPVISELGALFDARLESQVKAV